MITLSPGKYLNPTVVADLQLIPELKAGGVRSADIRIPGNGFVAPVGYVLDRTACAQGLG